MVNEPAEQAAPAASSARGKGRLLPIIIVAALMGIEGLGIYFLTKAMSPAPIAALAADLENGLVSASGKEPGEEYVEIAIAECTPSNMMSGKPILFRMRVSALVAAEDRERAEKLVRATQARIDQGVNTVIRSADPKHLAEPALGTLIRRLKQELDKIFGDETLIQGVIIQEFVPAGGGI